ncbi:ribose-phosphate pyrophosphokinase [Hephaestia mangrovi]|uniref:ribose-phosphate pyrophosphokinase n=1 Tax=Hephaestia mangrovi TaxID=2873268 RepID=UPI001CA725B5|nr:ribose-phosphate pyrophosphokinase [Hephaestia mangrovi]MBY8826980.1 ribose-phosphate pyrophosphokinase [Hephaestia mangrovi]
MDARSTSDEELAARIADVALVRSLLVAAAKRGESVSYSQALNELGTRFTRPKMRALCKTLGRIDELAEAAGEPELAVLVVREGDGLPGQGWWVGRSALGYDGSWSGRDAEKLVRTLQRKAFRYWKKRAS